MAGLHISFVLHWQYKQKGSIDIEKTYQNTYKKLLTFLYANPRFHFTFYFYGSYLEWLNKNHKEAVDILSELSNRKQVEFLTGAYYEPLLPLILPADRVGQIELLTTNLRKYFGKKPRGTFIPYSVWEPSLISSFKTSGLDYAFLDSELFKSKDEYIYQPKIMEDLGKLITLIPLHFPFTTKEQPSPDIFLKSLVKNLNPNEDSFISIAVSPSQLTELLKSSWFESFSKELQSYDFIETTTPTSYLKINSVFEKQYIYPATSSKFIPYDNIKINSIREFLYEKPQAQSLYSRMMYVNSQIMQYRGDSSRKKTAKQYLWQAQGQGAYFLLQDENVEEYFNSKEEAYKHLLMAEKMVREAADTSINEIVTSFDYDMDGKKEYLFLNTDFNAFISLTGGILYELDLLINNKNYSNTIPRNKKNDGLKDFYPKKLFIDHLIEEEEFKKYLADSSQSSAIFPLINYTETKFDIHKKELYLQTHALFGLFQQPVFLKKIYSIKENGISVQYILKNESPLQLKAKFAIESNLSITQLDDSQNIDLVILGNVNKMDCLKPCVHHNSVSLLKITDPKSNNTFIFEPNEDSGISIQPLTISRELDGKLDTFFQGTNFSFFWDLNIAPGYEVEKMLFLNIKPAKKNQTAKRKRNSLTKK